MEKPNSGTLIITRCELKDSILEQMVDTFRGLGLYALEKVFNKECEAHGAGQIVEDIAFYIYGKWVELYWNEKELEAIQIKSCKVYTPESLSPRIKKYLINKLCK